MLHRPFHLFLFAAFPILFLYVHNINEFSIGTIVLPLLATGLLALASWGVFTLLFRNRIKGALLGTIFIALFLAYGHFHHLIENASIVFDSFYLGPSRILAIVYAMIFTVVTICLARTRKSLDGLALFANLAGAFLLAGSLIQIGLFALSSGGEPSREGGTYGSGDVVALQVEPETPRPHIFYIILDAYAGADVLAEQYQLRENPLIDYLQGQGFYIVETGHSNYCQTTLSLASSLSMEYLDELVDQVGATSQDREPLRWRIMRNRIARLLKPLGYEFVTFASGYYSTEVHNADHYLSPAISLDEFQRTLLNTTPIPVLLDIVGSTIVDNLHRGRILYTLDHLSDALELDAPVFVLAHIIAPHPPFLFGPNGELRSSSARNVLFLNDGDHLVHPNGLSAEDYRQLYLDQLHYLNQRLISALEQLLSHGDHPLIVILQGDHGPGCGLIWEDPQRTNVRERHSILNAYLFPDRDYHSLYKEITPVNSFRVIFNQYFGTDLELLPDHSFFSTWNQPYAFWDVTDRVSGVE